MPDQELIKIQSGWKKDPESFFTKSLDVKQEHIWPKMRDVMLSVRDNKRTAVKAAHAVSKTYVAARLGLWFLYSFYPSTVITTAPSHYQVEEILWREIRKCHANARMKLGGQPKHTGLELEEKWFATGFSTRPDTVTQQATRFQGFHNENILIIFEEAAGIERLIWEAGDSLMSGGKVIRFLAIGNPICATGDFVNCFKSSMWNKITISVYDTPNYKEGREIIPGVSGREYVEDTKKKYGEDSNYFKARVLGEIPDQDIDALIPQNAIDESIGRAYHQFKSKKRFIVWDVADGGDDAHEISAFYDKEEIDHETIRGKKIEEVEPFVWRMLRKIGGNAIVVDGDGVGRVAIGLLDASTDEKTAIVPFFGSGKPNDEETYNSRKSEAAWQLRMDMIAHHVGIPNDPETLEDLCNFKLDNDRNKRKLICLEKKVDMKERLGRSPGKGDNFIMMAGSYDEVEPVSVEPSRYKRSDDDDSEYNWRTG